MVIWDNRRAIQLNNNRYMELKTKHKKEIRLWQFSWRRTLTCHNSINYWFMHHPASLRIETCRKFGEQERCVITAPGICLLISSVCLIGKLKPPCMQLNLIPWVYQLCYNWKEIRAVMMIWGICQYEGAEIPSQRPTPTK